MTSKPVKTPRKPVAGSVSTNGDDHCVVCDADVSRGSAGARSRRALHAQAASELRSSLLLCDQTLSAYFVTGREVFLCGSCTNRANKITTCRHKRDRFEQELAEHSSFISKSTALWKSRTRFKRMQTLDSVSDWQTPPKSRQIPSSPGLRLSGGRIQRVDPATVSQPLKKLRGNTPTKLPLPVKPCAPMPTLQSHVLVHAAQLVHPQVLLLPAPSAPSVQMSQVWMAKPKVN
jgi:hypothetical protein